MPPLKTTVLVVMLIAVVVVAQDTETTDETKPDLVNTVDQIMDGLIGNNEQGPAKNLARESWKRAGNYVKAALRFLSQLRGYSGLPVNIGDSASADVENGLAALNSQREGLGLTPLTLVGIVSAKQQSVNGRLVTTCVRVKNEDGEEKDLQMKIYFPSGDDVGQLSSFTPLSLGAATVEDTPTDDATNFRCAVPEAAPDPTVVYDAKESSSAEEEETEPSLVDEKSSIGVALPSSYDVRTKFPKCATTFSVIKNQGSCGGCYAFAASSAIADRKCIADGGDKKDYSVQDLLSCGSSMEGELCINMATGGKRTAYANGCEGGSGFMAQAYAMDHGLVPTSCQEFDSSEDASSLHSSQKQCVLNNEGSTAKEVKCATGPAACILTNKGRGEAKVTCDNGEKQCFVNNPSSSAVKIKCTEGRSIFSLNVPAHGDFLMTDLTMCECSKPDFGPVKARIESGNSVTVGPGRTRMNDDEFCNCPASKRSYGAVTAAMERPGPSVELKARSGPTVINDGASFCNCASENKVNYEGVTSKWKSTREHACQVVVNSGPATLDCDGSRLKLPSKGTYTTGAMEICRCPAGKRNGDFSKVTLQEIGGKDVIQNCKRPFRTRECSSPTKVYNARELNSVKAMKEAILDGGSIAGSMTVYYGFQERYQAGDIYKLPSTVHNEAATARLSASQKKACEANANCAYYIGGHAVVVVGWGEDRVGKGYWICRNSWGENWGDAGYFKIYMEGSGFEDRASVSYAAPKTNPRCPPHAERSCLTANMKGNTCVIKNTCAKGIFQARIQSNQNVKTCGTGINPAGTRVGPGEVKEFEDYLDCCISEETQR